MGGHCYAASEALYHMLGGKEEGFVPMQLPHEGESHWWVRDLSNGQDLDPTADQFTTPVPYHLGKGKGFLTAHPSKRALEIMRRIKERASSGEEPSKFVTQPYEVNKKQAAFAPDDWDKILRSPRQGTDWKGDASRYLYHGSPMRAVETIHQHGLLPFDHPNNPTASRYEGDFTVPRHNRVYLGDRRIVENFDTPWHRIDLSKLDPNNFGADEDHFILHSGDDIPPAPDEFKWREHGVHLGAWADAHADKLDAPHNTLHSLSRGSVSHFGPIPPEAIEFNPEVNMESEHERLNNAIENHKDMLAWGEDRRVEEASLRGYRQNILNAMEELHIFENTVLPMRYKAAIKWATENEVPVRNHRQDVPTMIYITDELGQKQSDADRRADAAEKIERRSFELDRVAKMRHEASWPDVMAKAKRMIQDGRVTLHRNGYNNIVATVIGDHGVYQPEISRDDPNSRAISQWTCECDWDQYAWGRTRQWKKYEGRPCSHVLATYWKALSTPLDEDAQGTAPTPGQAAPVDPMAQQQQLFDPASTMPAPAPPMPGQPVPVGMGYDPTSPVPATMQDLTIPQSPGAMVKPIGPLPDPYVNRPMFMPGDPQKERLFNLPGALSKRYTHLQNIDDIPVMVVIAGREDDDFQKILELSNAGKTPIVQAIQPIFGEYSGGKIPVPGAEPYDHHGDYELHHWWNLGWDPQTGMQANPPKSGPEARGQFGEIPAGARLEVWSVDETTRYILVAWSTPFGKLQHHLIKAWVEPKDIRLIPNQNTPFIQRPHG
jgi:hypothetical protein